MYYPGETEEAEKILGLDLTVEFADQANRGTAAISHLQNRFKEAAGKPFYLFTLTPEWLSRKRLPEDLTAVVTYENRYQLIAREEFAPI